MKRYRPPCLPSVLGTLFAAVGGLLHPVPPQVNGCCCRLSADVSAFHKASVFEKQTVSAKGLKSGPITIGCRVCRRVCCSSSRLATLSLAPEHPEHLGRTWPQDAHRCPHPPTPFFSCCRRTRCKL